MRLVMNAQTGKWLVEFEDPETGQRRRPSTGTSDRAEAHRRAPEVYAKATGKRTDSNRNFYSVGQALDATWTRVWQGQKGGLKKLSEVRMVRARWGQTPIESLTAGDVSKWVDDMLEAGLSAATINIRVSTLSRALKEAVVMEKLDTVPFMRRASGKKRRVVFITPEQEAALLTEAMVLNGTGEREQGGGAARYEGTGDVMAQLMVVLIYTGMRLSEVIKSRPEDMLSPDILEIFDPKSGSDAPETVLVLPVALAALRYLWAHPTWQKVTEGTREDTSTLEGLEEHLRRIASARDWCGKRFTILRNRLGLHHVSLHALRHTTASRLVQGGVDLYRVKDVMRHSSVKVTEGYAHLNKDSLRAGMGILAATQPAPAPASNVVTLATMKRTGTE